MSENHARLRAFKFYYDNGTAVASDELRDAMDLLRDYDGLAARLAEAEAENARLVAANKARDEFLRGHRYKHSEVDGYIDLCESQMATLKARLADAERNEETLLGMIRHQRDVLRECLPYINESMAGRRPGRCADDIRAAVKALTADSGSGGEQ